MTDNGIISLGDDYRDFSREYWGSRDRARYAEEQERQRRLSSTAALEPAPLHTLSANVAGKDVEGDARRRRREVNRLLEKFGLRERRWT